MDLDMEERIQKMALRTWDNIAGDCLRALEEVGEPPIMTRADVLETVCDAAYMKVYGGDEEAYKAWRKIQTFREKVDVLRPAFLHKTYGW